MELVSKKPHTVVLMLDSPEDNVLQSACEALYKFSEKCKLSTSNPLQSVIILDIFTNTYLLTSSFTFVQLVTHCIPLTAGKIYSVLDTNRITIDLILLWTAELQWNIVWGTQITFLYYT